MEAPVNSAIFLNFIVFLASGNKFQMRRFTPIHPVNIKFSPLFHLLQNANHSLNVENNSVYYTVSNGNLKKYLLKNLLLRYPKTPSLNQLNGDN